MTHSKYGIHLVGCRHKYTQKAWNFHSSWTCCCPHIGTWRAQGSMYRNETCKLAPSTFNLTLGCLQQHLSAEGKNILFLARVRYAFQSPDLQQTYEVHTSGQAHSLNLQHIKHKAVNPTAKAGLLLPGRSEVIFPSFEMFCYRP